MTVPSLLLQVMLLYRLCNFQIGLMRGGRLLAEESPDDLLRKYNSESLEDVFLKLSIIQNRGKRRRSSILHDVTAAINVPVNVISYSVFSHRSRILIIFPRSTGSFLTNGTSESCV